MKLSDLLLRKKQNPAIEDIEKTESLNALETAEKAEQLYCYYSIENRGLHHDNVDFNIIVQKKLKTKD